MPVFSIILPSFNAGLTIKSALDSILCQSFRDFELIIIDGLSSDNTLSDVTSYEKEDARIKTVSEADKGIYDAMNKGILRAKGDWIYFLGADDSLRNADVLQNVFENIKFQKDKKFFYGNVIISGDANWAYDGQIYDGVFSLEKLMTRNICHQSVFYQLDFIKNEVGIFNLNYRICADWDFNLRCWSKSEFFFMDLIIAQFNAGGESTINGEDNDFSNDLVANVLTYFEISPFDSIVNYPNFPQYGKLLDLQKRKSYLHYIFDRIKKKIIN